MPFEHNFIHLKFVKRMSVSAYRPDGGKRSSAVLVIDADESKTVIVCTRDQLAQVGNEIDAFLNADGAA